MDSKARSIITSVAILISLTALTLGIAARRIGEGGFSWSDAPLHAMDGVFIHDLITERPAGDLHGWAQQYYLKHQCLGIVVYYPPLFATIEAVLFLCFGVSVLSARITILLFAIGAVWLIYLLASQLFGKKAGIAAAFLTISVPAGVEWSTQVMLEWPATFFILLTLWSYWRYLEKPGWFYGILLGLSILASYFTKQTAVFVLIVVLLHALWDGQWKSIYQWPCRLPLIVALLVIVGYSAVTSPYNALGPQLIAGSPPFKHLLDITTWTWYFERLPQITGWPMLIGFLAILLIIPAIAKKNQRIPFADKQIEHFIKTLRLPVIWFCLWWLIGTVFAAKEERYFFFAVPAMGILVAAGLSLADGRKQFGVGSAALAVLCIIQVGYAIRQPLYRLPSMKSTVDFLVKQNDADLVLVDAVRDGQFIFDARTTPDARNRIIPMRASKFLYSRAARTRYDYQAHINTPEELYDWLDEYGVRYVVIENRLPATTDASWDTPPRMILRKALTNSRKFQHVFTQSLAGDHPGWQDVWLDTYRYRDAKDRQTNSIKIRIPAMNKELILNLPDSIP